MGKTRIVEEPPVSPVEAAEGDAVETDLAEHLRRVRAQRAYEKFMSLKGKIHVNIDIDELRGRNRR